MRLNCLVGLDALPTGSQPVQVAGRAWSQEEGREGRPPARVTVERPGPRERPRGAAQRAGGRANAAAPSASQSSTSAKTSKKSSAYMARLRQLGAIACGDVRKKTARTYKWQDRILVLQKLIQ